MVSTVNKSSFIYVLASLRKKTVKLFAFCRVANFYPKISTKVGNTVIHLLHDENGKKGLTFPRDLLLLCRPALSLRLRLKMEDLFWSAAFCSFFAALNCCVANSSARALFGTTPRWILSLFPEILKACQDPTTPLWSVSTTWKTSDLSKDSSPLSGGS